MNTDHSRYAPVSSEARAIRKGLPTVFANTVDAQYARSPMMDETRSRAKNYKAMIKHMDITFKGQILFKEVFSPPRKKDAQTAYIFMAPTKSGEIHLLLQTIPFRDPMHPVLEELKLTITNHVIERMAQRGDKAAVLGPLQHLLQFFMLQEGEGTYEVGCGTGLIVAKWEDCRLTAITFVDAEKLSPTQSAQVGANQKIR